MAALFVFPPPAVPFFCGGEGGHGCLGCPGTAPGGEGRSRSTYAAEVAASAPCAPPPPPWDGGGVNRRPLILPPPLGGIRGPRWGVNPPLWQMTPPKPPSAGGRCPQKYLPALGRGGGDEDAVVHPPPVCVRPGALTARATPVPRVPAPCPAVPRGRSGEGG